jgi:hypothetical protein
MTQKWSLVTPHLGTYGSDIIKACLWSVQSQGAIRGDQDAEIVGWFRAG